MKMTRTSIVTSGRRPARPDANHYRAMRKRGGGGRRRGKSSVLVVVLAILIGVVAYFWVF